MNHFPAKLVCLKTSYVWKGNLIANIKLKAITKLTQSVNLLLTLVSWDKPCEILLGFGRRGVQPGLQ